MKKKSDKLIGNKVFIDLKPTVAIKPTIMTPTNSNKNKGLLAGTYDRKKLNLPKTSTNIEHANV